MRKKWKHYIDRMLTFALIGILLPLFITIICQRMRLEEVIYGTYDAITETAEREGGEELEEQLPFILAKEIRADAEDAVSEAIVHAYEKLETLKKADSFRNWILQITANEAKKIYRHNKRTSPVAWEENLSPEFYDEHHELWDAVMRLDGGYRDVIVLFYYERCTIPEISRILECRQGTVKSRLHRAKEQLRAML